MRSNVRVSVVQHEPGDMDQRESNVDFIVSQLHALARRGCDLVVFPEVGITSFFRHEPGGLRTYWEKGAISLDGEEMARVLETVKSLGVHAIVGFAERSEVVGVIHNSAALISPDGLVGVARKVHMPGLEKLYYTPGDTVDVFDCELGRIGITICYDAMFPEYFKALSEQSAEIIVLTSSIWRGGNKGGVGVQSLKRDYWAALPMVTAVQNQAFVVSCNACGCLEMGQQVGVWERLGLSQIVAPTGQVLGQAGESDEEIVEAVLAAETLLEARTSYRFLTDRLL